MRYCIALASWRFVSDWHKRYRKIIDAYRGKLMEVNPAASNEVDDRMWASGEGWVCDDRPPELDRLMTAREIAERHGLEMHNIRAWARRHPDRIATHRKGGKCYFSVREVLAYYYSL